MTAVPADPFIYHITHVDNLPGILREGGLWSDAQRIARGLASTKHRARSHQAAAPQPSRNDECRWQARRLRSVQLLSALGDALRRRPRACGLLRRPGRHRAPRKPRIDRDQPRSSLGVHRPHAELTHALHFDDLARLGEVPWHVMTEHYWASVREERQAEFLVHASSSRGPRSSRSQR